MPNIQNQKKRAITNLKRSAANTSEKSALKTAMKHVVKAISEGDKAKATEALDQLNSRLDKAVSSGIHHKNYASRQKARFAKAIDQMS